MWVALWAVMPDPSSPTKMTMARSKDLLTREATARHYRREPELQDTHGLAHLLALRLERWVEPLSVAQYTGVGLLCAPMRHWGIARTRN